MDDRLRRAGGRRRCDERRTRWEQELAGGVVRLRVPPNLTARMRSMAWRWGTATLFMRERCMARLILRSSIMRLCLCAGIRLAIRAAAAWMPGACGGRELYGKDSAGALRMEFSVFSFSL